MYENIFLWVEILGWLGFVSTVLTYQAKTGRGILLFYIPSNILWVFYYSLINATAGAITCMITIIRNFMGLYLKALHLKLFIFALIPCIWILTYIYAESAVGYSAALGTSIQTIAVLYRDQSLKFRLSDLCAQIFWMFYGVMSGSWPLIFLCLFITISNLIGMFRHENYFRPLRNKAKIFVRNATKP